jgi:hypothetical protein
MTGSITLVRQIKKSRYAVFGFLSWPDVLLDHNVINYQYALKLQIAQFFDIHLTLTWHIICR